MKSSCISCEGVVHQLGIYDDFHLITSDCRPWTEQVGFGYCDKCCLLQRPRSDKWKQNCVQIYQSYEAYRLGKKQEQKTFSNSGLSKSRSHFLIDQFQTKYQCNSIKNWLDYGCGDGLLFPHVKLLFPNVSLSGVDFGENNRSKVEAQDAKYYRIDQEITEQFDLISLVHVVEHFPDLLGRVDVSTE